MAKSSMVECSEDMSEEFALSGIDFVRVSCFVMAAVVVLGLFLPAAGASALTDDEAAGVGGATVKNFAASSGTRRTATRR